MAELDRRSAQPGPTDTVDFYELIFRYIREKHPFPREIRSKLDLDHLNSRDVIENNLKVYNRPIVYKIMDDSSHPRKDDAIAFSSVFTNSTSSPQTNHLNTTRTTTNTCTFTLAKALTREGSLELELGVPQLGMQLKGGLKEEVSLCNEKSRTVQEELTWSLDSEVIVPAGRQTLAELVITEERTTGTFSIDTIIEGKLAVAVRDRKTKEVTSVVSINDLTQVFTPKDGFDLIDPEKRTLRFINSGTCSSRCGVAQKVVLTESAM